jgi:hypothetical protein
MTEYLISANEAPGEWFEEVVAHKGVKERTRDLRFILIESSPEIIEQLQKKFPYLKIQEVMVI